MINVLMTMVCQSFSIWTIIQVGVGNKMSFLPLTQLTPTLKVAVVDVEGITDVNGLIDILPIDDCIVSMVFGDIQKGIPQSKYFKHNLTIRLVFKDMNVVVRIKKKFHITGIRTTQNAIDVTHYILDAISEADPDHIYSTRNMKIKTVTDVMQNYSFRLPKPINVHIFPDLVPEDIFDVCRSWSSKEKMTLKYEIEDGKYATFTISASGSVALSGKSGKLMIPAYNEFVRMYLRIKDKVSIDGKVNLRLSAEGGEVSDLPQIADLYMRELSAVPTD